VQERGEEGKNKSIPNLPLQRKEEIESKEKMEIGTPPVSTRHPTKKGE